MIDCTEMQKSALESLALEANALQMKAREEQEGGFLISP